MTGAPERGGLAVVCSQAAPARLDPFITGDLLSADLRMLLYTPLVLYDSAGGLRPYLATDWVWSPDHRTLTLHIRRDVVWHDGVPVTARDVAWTLGRAADPEWNYWAQSDFASLESATAKDSATVEVRFTASYVAGVEPLTVLPILPEHLLGRLSARDFREAAYHRDPVGSGPFRVAERRPDGSVVFERFDRFPAALGSPRLDRIALRVTPEPATMLTELRTGAVDACVAGSALAKEASAAPGLRLIPLEPAGLQALPLNNRASPLDDARVRRALSAAIRRAAVAAVVSPLAKPARSFLPAVSPYRDSLARQPDDDTALAARLLREAGWADPGPDGLRHDAAGRPLRIRVVAPQPFQPALTVIQAQLRRVGVGLDLEFMEWASYLGMLRKPETRPQAMALSGYPDKVVEPDFYDNFATHGGNNFSSYSSPVVDSLLDRLRTAVRPEQRKALYVALQQRITEDAPVLYVVSAPRLEIVGPRLRGVSVDLNGPFASVTEWWIPTASRR
ncbi:MAG: peptide ABC transporter substrate-binding protein [Gemmatimonadetes bacterium]|nr:peptide ABC transporter substrate-binding protein [Gemmatimonadota bacterium]